VKIIDVRTGIDWCVLLLADSSQLSWAAESAGVSLVTFPTPVLKTKSRSAASLLCFGLYILICVSFFFYAVSDSEHFKSVLISYNEHDASKRIHCQFN